MDTAMVQITPEMEVLKTRLKATWISGDFRKIAESFADGAAEFVERLNLKPGIRVLDVGCGSGNQSIPAARLGAKVTGVDIAPNLIEQAQHWATSEGLKIQFDEGDAESLPYADASFDVVMSMFGAMFAPRPDTGFGGTHSCLSSRRRNCVGKLDSKMFYRADVQDRRIARFTSAKYAFAFTLGR